MMPALLFLCSSFRLLVTWEKLKIAGVKLDSIQQFTGTWPHIHVCAASSEVQFKAFQSTQTACGHRAE